MYSPRGWRGRRRQYTPAVPRDVGQAFALRARRVVGFAFFFAPARNVAKTLDEPLVAAAAARFAARFSAFSAAMSAAGLRVHFMCCTLWCSLSTASSAPQPPQTQPHVPLNCSLEKLTVMMCPPSNTTVVACAEIFLFRRFPHTRF